MPARDLFVAIDLSDGRAGPRLLLDLKAVRDALEQGYEVVRVTATERVTPTSLAVFEIRAQQAK